MVALRVLEGGAECGGCWGKQVLRVVGFGVEEAERVFPPLETRREKVRGCFHQGGYGGLTHLGLCSSNQFAATKINLSESDKGRQDFWKSYLLV